MDVSKLKGKNREIAELIGEEGLIQLAKQFGGSKIYIPTLSTLKRSEVSEELKRQYNGNNAAELGRKYKLSERTVIRMIMKKST